MPVILDRLGVAGLIPHRDAMCLLHEVLEADDEQIRCRAVNHRNAAHPLRDAAGLPAICGIEYAAQAIAVHGAIKSGSPSGSGVLAALRDVKLHVERLDELREDILIVARRLLDEGGRLVYEFSLRAGAQELVEGRATVVLKRILE